ncbi:GAD-like domain-containing protein [Nocardia sp. NPDC020380]|uniref:GAD-like domain-containing protein n=1 Tax=Nocardia sp. NPDC020380 TaxID=3364309 RepID=UPI0037AAE2B8
MSFQVSEVTNKWGQPSHSTPVPPQHFRKYAGQVPDYLLDLWRHLGFAGFQKGMLWLCDPEKWQPAVDEWTSGIDLPFGQDRWVAVTRSAFGDMTLWGERTGLSLTVTPYRGWIFPVDGSGEMSDDFDRDLQILASLLSKDQDTFDPTGDDNKPLFKRLLKDLGPVGPDTMYGFVPTLALGGSMLPSHVEIVDADVHMQILSQTTHRIVMNNPY